MKEALATYLLETNIISDKEEILSLPYSHYASFERDIKTKLESPLFTYQFKHFHCQTENNLPEMFITVIEGQDHFVFKRNNLFVYGNKNIASVESLLGKELLVIEIQPTARKVDELIDFVKINFSRYQLFGIFLIAFVLLTPLFANIFNTRLIFSDTVFSFIYISTFFILGLLLEFFLKKIIKSKVIVEMHTKSLAINRYLALNARNFKGQSVISSVKTVESYCKQYWERIPLLLTDGLTFTLVMLILILFLKAYSLILLSYYLLFSCFSIYYRFKNYTSAIEQEKTTNDDLLEKLSLIENKPFIPFLNQNVLDLHFLKSQADGFKTEKVMSHFNFNWGELAKAHSFLSMFFLFLSCYLAINFNHMPKSAMIAILLMNGRASGMVASFIGTGFGLKLALHHLRQSFTSLFPEDETLIVTENKKVRITSLGNISASNLGIAFDEKIVLDQVNFTFNSGVIHAIIGGSGSGKSSLVNALLRRDPSYTGSIHYNNGIKLEEVDDHFFSQNVAYINSSFSLFRGSIYYNFNLRGCFDLDYIKHVLIDVLGLESVPEEMLFEMDAAAIPMSTGQRARIMIKMSLYKKADLIVIDEGMIGISDSDKVDVFKLLREKYAHAIILIISHDKNVINMCDLRFLLKDKKLLLLSAPSAPQEASTEARPKAKNKITVNLK